MTRLLPAFAAALGLFLAFLGAPLRASGAGDGPLVLVLNSDDPPFSWARVKQAMALALPVLVVADDDARAGKRRGTLTIAWRPTRHELAVTYEDARGIISRVIPAPARADDGIEAAVALAVNLIRDQAFELLGAPATAPPAALLPAPAPAAPPPTAPNVDRVPATSAPAVIQASPLVPARATPPQPRFMIAVLGGTGVGWASGPGAVLTQTVASPAGLAWARVAHIAPEFGYHATPRLLLSLQGRLQFITGTTDVYLPDGREGCGADHVCSAPRTAAAVFVKGTLFSPSPRGPVRPYVSLAVGGGSIRYVAPAQFASFCGPTRTESCVDSYGGGPVFAVPGAGLHVQLLGGLDLVAAVELALGVPHATFNLDANLGASFGF